MKYVFPVTTPAIPVVGTDSWFPVRRIYCVGRNYADHAIEMGGDPKSESPFFFSKPPDAVVVTSNYAFSSSSFASSSEATRNVSNSDNSIIVSIPYPSATKLLHHEVELVVAIGREGVNIPIHQSLDHVFGYGVGVDLTRRDLQAVAKTLSRPWDCAKGFDHSAPIGALTEKQSIESLQTRSIWLDVDGRRQQTGNLDQMIWNVPEVISILSTQFQLTPGDLIFTGTPSGVGPITKGQRVTAGIEGLTPITFYVD